MCHLFRILLNKDNSFTIHHQNIQPLATETYKTLNNLPGETFEGLITLRIDCNSLSSEQEVITVLEGKISFRYSGANISVQFQVILKLRNGNKSVNAD